MTLTLLALGFLVLIAVGYRFYGRWVARQFKLDDGRITPRAALTMASILFLPNLSISSANISQQ